MDSSERLAEDVIKNTQDINHLREVFTMALQNLETKIDTGFNSVNGRLDKVEERLDTLEKSLPERVDERIKTYNKDKIFNLIKWIIVAIATPITVSIVTKIIVSSL